MKFYLEENYVSKLILSFRLMSLNSKIITWKMLKPRGEREMRKKKNFFKTENISCFCVSSNRIFFLSRNSFIFALQKSINEN